ncbi:MAG: hypothetical protein AB1631_29585 [Acidobacteriota bacterium]
MTAACVADDLGLSDVTVRLGEAGTRCLYKGRVKQGRKIFYARVQVQAHKRQLCEKGRCNESCLSVLKAGAEKELRAVG